MIGAMSACDLVWLLYSSFYVPQKEGGQCEHSPVNLNTPPSYKLLTRLPVKCTCRSVDGTRQSSST